MLEKMKRLVVEEEGQGLSEYGLILAGIVAVAITLVAVLTGGLSAFFTEIVGELANVIE